MQGLARQTLSVAQRLLDLLAQIKVARLERGKLESIRRALKSAVSENEIHELEKRLVSIRSELTLRVLVSMRTSSAAQAIRHDSRLDLLSSNLQVTVRDILDGNVTLLSERIDQSTTKLAYQQQSHHEEILHALSGISVPPILSSQQAQAVDVEQLSKNRAVQTEDFILQELTFREISDRADSIDRAHEKTFKWIFEKASNDKYSNFVQWLHGNDSLYWIRGKAGSGKSTLMKYLSGSKRTINILKGWASDSTLHVASFHFWNLGTALQRSQAGLLRALLLSLLSKHRNLLKDSMPGYYTGVSRMIASDMKISAPQPLSLTEIKAAFTRAVKAFSSHSYACIFIDGLDEYEGDVNEILDLFLPVLSEKFKMVVSSRPIPSCLTAFQEYPHLRLEDLTRPDILSYTKQQLESHPNVVRLKQHYQAGLDKVIEELVKKSSGVFLWVILVVKLLLHSLDAGDSLKELSQQLDTMPTELGPFYKHMLDKMEPSYRRQASWYLQMVLQSIEVQLQNPLDLIQCFLAEFYGETKAFPDSDQDLTYVTSSFWTESSMLMEQRLVSRCCGLVEAMNQYVSYGLRTVAFIHKSVADFLRQPEIWAYLIDLTKDERNDVNFVLGRSRALHMRITSKGRTSMDVETSEWYRSIDYCLRYLRKGELSARRTSPLALRELSSEFVFWARVNEYFLSGRQVSDFHHTPGKFIVPNVSFRTVQESYLAILLAASNGLQLHFRLLYAERKSKSLGCGPAVSKDNAQLLQLLLERIILEWSYRERCLNEHVGMIEFLLENGADPNEASEGSSPWELLLQRPTEMISIGIVGACLDLIPIFLRRGAMSTDTRIANGPTQSMASARKLALNTVDDIIKCTSPACGQLYLKAIQARKMLFESSEEIKIIPTVQVKETFSKTFSRVLRRASGQPSLLPVRGKTPRAST